MPKATQNLDEARTFDDFAKRALDPSLSSYEKIGFQDQFRKGFGKAILKDITRKLVGLRTKRSSLLDIGCGSSDLTNLLISQSNSRQQDLHLIDHENVLKLIKSKRVHKHPGRFPEDFKSFVEQSGQKFDAILVYSVIQYVFREGNIFDFLDQSMELLKPGGQILLGDIPNASMRKRLLDSEEGRRYHRKNFGRKPYPKPEDYQVQEGDWDDSVTLEVLAHARRAGFNSLVMRQSSDLPFANRREDILIERPG